MTTYQNDTNLVWMDLEMTGLDPKTHRIIEIATIVTDSDLNILEEGPTIAIHQPQSELDKMDNWNVRHHNDSGLVPRVQASDYDERKAELATLDFIQQWVNKGKSPLCGNTICQDRRFLVETMPELAAYFHYRNIDVSTIKQLCQRWAPNIAKKHVKTSTHEALQDIRDSIDELRYYKTHWLNQT